MDFRALELLEYFKKRIYHLVSYLTSRKRGVKDRYVWRPSIVSGRMCSRLLCRSSELASELVKWRCGCRGVRRVSLEPVTCSTLCQSRCPCTKLLRVFWARDELSQTSARPCGNGVAAVPHAPRNGFVGTCWLRGTRWRPDQSSTIRQGRSCRRREGPQRTAHQRAIQ